jgi:hypothetical protein
MYKNDYTRIMKAGKGISQKVSSDAEEIAKGSMLKIEESSAKTEKMRGDIRKTIEKASEEKESIEEKARKEKLD